ncbi:MAG: flavodoxin family protein [Anaerolineae bacterium]|nr:flavodoxin family protein [Anaerolineae bacterium]MDW8103107.1 flavodoxin family protein [Anaerolineae bacterium]
MILGIMGSPRRGGNSEILLDQALAGARSAGADTEKVVLGLLNIQGCTHCSGCWDTGECIIEDDMGLFYRKFREMEAIIVAAPLYFLGPPAQLKAVIDRCEVFWVLKTRFNISASPTGKKRPGAFISVAGAPGKPDTFDPSRRIIRAFFSTIDVAYSAELFFTEVEEPGKIRAHPTALAEAYTLGVRIARSL